VPGGGGTALAVKEAHVVVPTRSPAFDDLVAAQRVALGELSRAIAARLVALPAATGAR